MPDEVSVCTSIHDHEKARIFLAVPRLMSYEVECEHCRGRGMITVSNERRSLRCGHCNGSGFYKMPLYIPPRAVEILYHDIVTILGKPIPSRLQRLRSALLWMFKPWG